MTNIPRHRIKKVASRVSFDNSIIKEDIIKEAIKEIGLDIAEKLFEFNKVVRRSDGKNDIFHVEFDIIVPETPEENKGY